MSAELDELYQSIILDHNRRPQNFRAMADASAQAEGVNPMCGDQLTVWLRMQGEQVADVSFQGSGCAISKASASLMTAAVKGKSRAEVQALFADFHAMVTGRGNMAHSTGGMDVNARLTCTAPTKNAPDGCRGVRSGLASGFGCCRPVVCQVRVGYAQPILTREQ